MRDLMVHARRALRSLAWLTIPLWLGPLAWWLAYDSSAVVSYAGVLLLSVDLMFVFGALVAAAVVLAGPFVALSRSRRVRALITIGQAIVFLLSFVGGLWLGRIVWRDRVERVVARAEPLVVAIQKFTANNGTPPQTLDELVPQHLSIVPTTGIGAFPRFRYVVDKPQENDGNPWVLLVTPPCPVMGFDSLMYFPLQNYPTAGYGGVIERIGKWGYVHE